MPSCHVIVLPGGGYQVHAPHEAEPVAAWLGSLGLTASVFRYPLNTRHPRPLDAVRAEIAARRADGARRVGFGLRRQTSLDRLAHAGAPPFFIWHTAEDIYVPPEHSYRLASALAAHGVAHALHVFEHGPHSLGLAIGAGETARWTELAASWLEEQPSEVTDRTRKVF